MADWEVVSETPAPQWEVQSTAPAPKKNYALSEVPGAAVDSISKTFKQDIPKAIDSAMDDPVGTVGKVAKGGVDAIKSLLSVAALPLTSVPYVVGRGVAPEAAERWRKDYMDPGVHLLEGYQSKYGGWLGGPDKWGWTPEQGWGNVKRSLAEQPISTATDVASIGLPAAVGVSKVVKGDSAAATTTRRALFDDAGISPTKGMLTGQHRHITEEDNLRRGAKGSLAADIMNAADAERLADLNKSTNKLRVEFTGEPVPMSPLAIGETISNQFTEANTAAKGKVRKAYEQAFDPAELQARGIPSHVPEADLKALPDAIHNKLLSGDQPFVATKEAAPSTAAAVEALREYALTGRLPSVVPAEIMPPGGAAGSSWQSVDLMRRYINGLRESAKANPTDLLGMRKVLDAFDESFGKSNPLLNDARGLHRDRVSLFDPGRFQAGAGVRNVLQAAANTENTGFTLYHKLFGGAHMNKGEALKTVSHLKEIFKGDPVGFAAVKEGALQRLFHDPKTYEQLSPQKAATKLNEALNGPMKETYTAIFTPEEIARLQKHQNLMQVIADHMRPRNPSGTSYNTIADRSRDKYRIMGAAAGAAAGHKLGLPGVVGESLGAGAGAMLGPIIPERLAARQAQKMSYPDTTGAFSPIPLESAARTMSMPQQEEESRARGGYLRRARRS